jgi:hypothetical protein
MHISSQHLAELLVGIARAQAAAVHGLENEKAHLRNQAQPTLTDLPVRILLNTMGKATPDPAAIAKELERLCGAGEELPSGGPGKDLDFGAPPP